MANQLTRYATVATVDTAGEGYFFGVSIEASDFGVGTIISGVDQCRAYQFVLPFRTVVRKITSEITTGGGASKKYGVGLFDVNGDLILETGALDANTTQILTTSITAVTLEPGIYWLGQTSDSATTAMRVVVRGTIERDIFINSGTIIFDATTSNAGSAGVLPSSMGSLVNNAVRQPGAVLFQP